MSPDDKELIFRVFSSVFEDFAFMFVDEAPDFAPYDSGPGLRAKIEFDSEGKMGALEIVAPLDFCCEAARNILGTDPEELPENAGEQALKEMANILCGCLLAAKFGTDEIFDFSIPAMETVSKQAWNGLVDNRRHIVFAVDESPFLAQFLFQEKKADRKRSHL